MTCDDMVRLVTHMEWADARIWNEVLTTEATRRDGAVIERLHHIHLVQRIYLEMWLCAPQSNRDLALFTDLPEIQQWAREYYAELLPFIRTLAPDDLAGSVAFPWADQLAGWFGEARIATLEETILQVVMHSVHHRGQLATIIREHGGNPPLIDLIGWIWMGKPAPVWE